MRDAKSLPRFAIAAALLVGCNVYDPSLLGAADGGPEATPCTSKCGGACVDLASDPKNCGACGKVCAGTCASGLCEAEVLIDQRNAPHGIAVDGSQIFFTEYSAVQVTAIDKADGKNPVVVSGQAVYPEGIALDTGFVYFTSANDLVGAIGRAPKSGGSVQLAKSLPTPSAIALDGNGFVYVTTGPTNKATGCLPTSYTSGIMRCPISGCFVASGCPTSGGPETVFTDVAVPSGLTIVGTTLVATSRVGKWLKTCTLPACSDLATFGGTFVGPTDVVADKDAIYVADTDGGTIVRCDRSTKGCNVLASGLDQPWRLAIDAGALFFTTYAKGAKNAAGVYQCAPSSCGSTGPTKRAPGTALYGIALDAQYVYFTEEGTSGVTSTDGKVRRFAR